MASLEDHLEANGARLSRLLIDKGTKAVRIKFYSIHPPATLNATLTSYRSFFKGLRYVNCSQMAILFPPSGVPSKAEDYDITLLFVLLRNICNLNPPVSTGSWNTDPPASDTSMEANLARIKYYRNKLYGHITGTGINDADFCSYWKDISTALISLGIDVGEIELLKTSPLDKSSYLNQVKEWKENDERLEVIIQESQKEAKGEREHHHKETTGKLNTITETLEQVLSNQGKSIVKSEKNSNDQMLRKQGFVKKLKKMFSRKKSKKKPKNSLQDDYNSGKHILDTLVKCDFSGDIRKHNKAFHQGSRNWLLEKRYHWLEDEDSNSPVMILTAGPGVGKSVFAAKVCQLFAEKELLAACHFCKFNYVDYSDPHKMLQSLALQMCENVRGFREELIAQLDRDHSRSTVSDAFRVLLKDPLNSLADQEPMLIVIDALDESESDGKSELLELIEEEFSELPAWIKVFLTSRPELPVQERLMHLNAVEIRPDHKDNKADLKSYLECCLKKHGIRCNSIEELVGRCEGSFLYAYHCQLELYQLKRKGKLPADGNFDDFIPRSIGASYEKYFKRLARKLKELSGDIDISQILEVLVAMQSPLPLGFVAEILKLPTDTVPMKKVICRVNDSLSALLLVYDDCLTVFHKTVVDWLLLSGKYRRHEFAVQEKAGHKHLWKACRETFMKLEHSCTAKEVKTTMKKYALDHGLQHFKEATFHAEINPENDEDHILSNTFTIAFEMYFRPDERAILSGYGWVLLQDDEDAYIMTTSQVIRHIKDHQRQRDRSQPKQMPTIKLFGKNDMVESFQIEVDADTYFVAVTSDEESVLDYAVLRLKTTGLFNPVLQSSKRHPAFDDKVYLPDPNKYFGSKYAGAVVNYPEDLVEWLKTKASSDTRNIRKGIPVLRCNRDIEWNKVEEQNVALIYHRPSAMMSYDISFGLPLIDGDNKVVGMHSSCVWLMNSEVSKEHFICFNIRLDKIIQDITRKNPVLARKLFSRD